MVCMDIISSKFAKTRQKYIGIGMKDKQNKPFLLQHAWAPSDRLRLELETIIILTLLFYFWLILKGVHHRLLLARLERSRKPASSGESVVVRRTLSSSKSSCARISDAVCLPSSATKLALRFANRRCRCRRYARSSPILPWCLCTSMYGNRQLSPFGWSMERGTSYSSLILRYENRGSWTIRVPLRQNLSWTL